MTAPFNTVQKILEAMELKGQGKMISCELEALDGKPITPRTGKALVKAETMHLPVEKGISIFIYDNETCESPGVHIATDNLENIGNEYRFFDDAKRPFRMTILSLPKETPSK